MSEELKQESQEVQLSPIEQRALDQGWRPKEEWSGEEEDFIDAKEFLRRGELFSKIDSQKRELNELKQAIKALQTHHEKVKETEYKRAIADLKAAKKDALELGDAAAVVQIDDQIDDLREAQLKEEKQQVKAPATPPEFNEFKSRNKWYDNDRDLTEYADFVGTRYAASNPGTPLEDVFKHVEDQVKRQFPEKFQNQNRQRPNPVEGSTQGAGRKAGFTEADLTDDERTVMRTLVRGGHMTKEQYLKEVKAIREAN